MVCSELGCKTVYCIAISLLYVGGCVVMRWIPFLSWKLDDTAGSWAVSCRLLTDSVAGGGNLDQFSHWRKWLVINAVNQDLPLENAALTKNICAEMEKLQRFTTIFHFDFAVSFNYNNEIFMGLNIFYYFKKKFLKISSKRKNFDFDWLVRVWPAHCTCHASVVSLWPDTSCQTEGHDLRKIIFF